MSTIKDIARAAGVSVATVSNALNGKASVKPATIAKIRQLARELNYKPNMLAKGLVTKRFGAVGIMLSGPPSFNVFTNQSIMEMVQHIAATLSAHDYAVMLNVADLSRDDGRAAYLARTRACDGMVIIDTRSSDAALGTFIERLSIPSVLTVRTSPASDVPFIAVDNVQCGYLGARHLLEAGHRQIAYVGVMPGVGISESRLKGYRKAIAEYGISDDTTWCLAGDHYQESGRAAALEFLRLPTPRPTAIVAGNDLMALGIIEVLNREGVRVPEDISIVGCDNLPNSHMLRTPLTSVAIPFDKIGRMAAEAVLRYIDNPAEPPASDVLQPELRVRGSVRILTDR